MFLKQYYLGCLAHASYLVADEKTKTAVVVDPQRDVDQYLADAAEHGFSIEHVFLTHFHADFLAGHLELRERTGAKIHLGARAEAEYAFVAHEDGDALEFGDLRLGIIETPGHTPEGICILVYDLAKDRENPQAVLTGDTLFIGDIGRPDLMASIGVSAEELASMMYDSLHEKLLKLPDETLVYPAHGAGSMCGKSLSKDTVSTIGAQRRHNYALQPMSREEFIAMATSSLPKAPAYFSYDAMLNRKERETLEHRLGELRRLGVEEVLTVVDREDAQVLDVRDAADFAGAHWKGSVNIGLDGRFATWAGTLLDPARPVVIVAEPGTETEAAMRLGRIGFDRIAGYLGDGMLALEKRPELQARTERITASTLAERLEDEAPPLVLDVRTEDEWNGHHIEGSLNVPLAELGTRLDEVPRDRRVVAVCRSGYRSSAAASLLQRAGFDGVLDEIGGMIAWDAQDPACEAGGSTTSCTIS